MIRLSSCSNGRHRKATQRWQFLEPHEASHEKAQEKETSRADTVLCKAQFNITTRGEFVQQQQHKCDEEARAKVYGACYYIGPLGAETKAERGPACE